MNSNSFLDMIPAARHVVEDMFKPWSIKPSHEDLFIGHYEQMLRWAMKLAGQDHQLAEDIVHDAFIQFTLARPDLAVIQNLEAYLYTMLRNRHISRVRRSARFAESLPVMEFDSASVGLRAIDPRDLIQAQEELSAICRYACARKESSKAGSILILRFFLGYYPTEIARIIKGTRAAVDSWVCVARAEARAFLDDKRNFHFIRQSNTSSSERHSDDDFLTSLRSQVSDSLEGKCLLPRHLEKLYDERNSQSPDARALGHIVSCKDCLDRVCAMLGLAPPSDRHPTDSIGTDRSPKRGSTGKGISSGINLRSQTFEHVPRKLFVSVNGFFLGSHSISSQLNELTLSAHIDEQIGFVEILSEQGLLLLAMDVEPPPAGDIEQRAQIELSGSRLLEATLSFVDSWPEIRVDYSDPEFIEAPATIEDKDETPIDLSTEEKSRAGWLIDFARRVFNRDFLLRPATITAVVAMIVIAVLLVARLRPSAVSAAEVLDRAEAVEKAAVDNPQIALHRTLSLEEREDGNLVSRHRIELWQSGLVKARRVFDEQNRLIAGEWISEKGATIYDEAGGVRRLPQPADLNPMDAWRLEPSAQVFSALIKSRDRAWIKEDSHFYTISFESDELKIALTLNKADLHAIEQNVAVKRGASRVEYRLVEERFERLPRRVISPFVFEPDTNVLNSRGEIKGEMKSINPASSTDVQAVASADLEVEVRWLLDQIRANQGEQIELARTSQGKLLVEGIVESDERKREIVRALDPVITNPAVRVEILTVAEAKKLRKSGFSTARSQQIEIGAGATIPLYSEVKTHLVSRGVEGDKLEEEINRYSRQLMALSREALSHAWALRRIIQTRANELSEEARARRLSMIRRHALAFEQKTARLRAEIETVLAVSAPPVEAAEIKDEAALMRAIAQLVDMASFNDEAVRSSLSISSANSTAMVKTYQFRLSLRRAEQLAASLKTASDLR